ncbi:MAG: tetratricopeptide repeat protein [Cyclonatronaceae bacterium]
MKINFTRMAGLVLAFGFFFGCKAPSDLTETRSLFESGQLQLAADQAGHQVSRNPENAEGHYLYGQILMEIAAKAAPPVRLPYYEKASHSLYRASELFGSTEPAKAQNALDLLINGWAAEMNRPQTALNDSRSFDQNELSEMIHHTSNAIALIPDSTAAFLARSEIYYYLSDPASAVVTLEEIPVKNADIFERIGFFYSIDNHPVEAADAFEQAYQLDTENINVLFGLINTLVEAGMSGQAISRIGDLSLKNPANPLFPALEGTLRFDQTDNWFMDRIDDQSIHAAGVVAEGLAMLDLAETVFRRASDRNDGDPDIHAAIGTFYLNAAGLLIDLTEITDESNDQALEQRVTSYLNNSIPHLRLVAEYEQDPSFWLSLHQIYLYLGMDEEAEAALQNAGL